MAKPKKARQKRQGMELAQSRYNKMLRQVMPGTSIFYCDMFGMDMEGQFKTRMNGAGKALVFLAGDTALLSKEIVARQWNWQVMAFVYCDDGNGVYIEHRTRQKKGVPVNTINEVVEADLEECRAEVNSKHELTWGWLAIIRPDSWDQDDETEAQQIAVQAELVKKVEQQVRTVQIAALEAELAA